MEDRELLELAAKAAWYNQRDPATYDDELGIKVFIRSNVISEWWNPLRDDGAALRLAVHMRINLEFDLQESGDECVYSEAVVADGVRQRIAEPLDNHHAASTRLAIVRAAAEMAQLNAAEQSGD